MKNGLRTPAFLVAVVVLSAVAAGVWGQGAAAQGADNRESFRAGIVDDLKIIFVQGINSESGNSNCSRVGFISDGQNRIQWMVDYLLETPWVNDNVPSLNSPEDFFYFSYSGNYCRRGDGSSDFQKPQYSDGDTCDGVSNASRRLEDLLRELLRDNPEARFTLIGHSMGGMVISDLVRQHPNMLDRVNSVITFDSPLRGVPNSILAQLNKDSRFPCIPFFSQSWDDLECDDYTRIPDGCQSTIVPNIAGVGNGVPFFTMDAVGSDVPLLDVEFVPGDRSTLLDSNSVLHCQFGDNHNSLWDTATTDGRPIPCWMNFTYPNEVLNPVIRPPDFKLNTLPDDIKAIFVACAVVLDREACRRAVKALPSWPGTGSELPVAMAPPRDVGV